MLKFIGYDTFGNAGPVGTETYTIDSTGPTVTAAPTTGTFGPVGTSVALSSADTDLDKIFYTTDGTEPDNTDTEYTGRYINSHQLPHSSSLDMIHLVTPVL